MSVMWKRLYLVFWIFGLFHLPFLLVRNMNCIASKFQHRKDVALARVAYHAESPDVGIEEAAEVHVFVRCLVGYDDAIVKILSQP